MPPIPPSTQTKTKTSTKSATAVAVGALLFLGLAAYGFGFSSGINLNKSDVRQATPVTSTTPLCVLRTGYDVGVCFGSSKQCKSDADCSGAVTPGQPVTKPTMTVSLASDSPSGNIQGTSEQTIAKVLINIQNAKSALATLKNLNVIIAAKPLSEKVFPVSGMVRFYKNSISPGNLLASAPISTPVAFPACPCNIAHTNAGEASFQDVDFLTSGPQLIVVTADTGKALPGTSFYIQVNPNDPDVSVDNTTPTSQKTAVLSGSFNIVKPTPTSDMRFDITKAPNTPEGPTVGSQEQVIARYSLETVFNDENLVATAKLLNITLVSQPPTQVDGPASGYLRFYVDTVSPSTLLGTSGLSKFLSPNGIVKFAYGGSPIGQVKTIDIAPGQKKILIITADTSKAKPGSTLTVEIKPGDIIATTPKSGGLPLFTPPYSVYSGVNMY